ncbi:MAG TPA: ATP-binding protein, partial [Rhodothermales bacterium]|nr:ATP-binding protein [Rhodothermales bacterium]
VLRPLAEQKGLQLVLAGATAPARADRAALGRVLVNLIGNAIKFTEHGGVTVTAGTGADGVYLRVTDTGVGIAAAFLPHLFDEFKQESEGHERTHEGNGLGLAITKRLVVLMGGTIVVESAPGHGSTFTVTLPRSVAAPSGHSGDGAGHEAGGDGHPDRGRVGGARGLPTLALPPTDPALRTV